MKHFNIAFRPDGTQISIHKGATLLEAAGQAGIILNSVCGGRGACKKCIVNIEPGGQQVLACQYHIQSDLVVTIPATSRFFEQKILTSGIDSKTKVRPDIYKKYKKPHSTDKIFGLAIDIGTTTVVAKLIDMTTGQCLAAQADLNPQAQYGDDVISRIAFAQTDAKLAELHTLIIKCINKLTARLCSQTSVNASQIYEICAVGNTTMNHIFLKLPITSLGSAPYKAVTLEAKDIPPDELGLRINPAGNIHTVENIAGFVGSDTTAVALAVDINSAKEPTLAVDIGTNGEIVLGASGKLYAASCAAGPAFEGARISCGSRAVEGAIEAVIVEPHGFTAVAPSHSSAKPAEAGHPRLNSRGFLRKESTGLRRRVNDGDIDFDVIGNCPPHSVCGSGLVDAMAALLDLGIVDATGCFVAPDKLPQDLPSAIRSRITEYNDQPAFYLHRVLFSPHPCGGGSLEPNVSERSLLLTQDDVRQLQLAKAAIRAGIKLLQKRIGLQDSDIQQVFLAGAFGNYIRRESALRIGLLPDIAAEKIHFVGNAASSGAEMALISSKCRTQAEKLARKIEYVELANEKDFISAFAESMLF